VRRVPRSLNAEGMAAVGAAVPTGAVVAEASMEAVAEATSRAEVGTFLEAACAAADRRGAPP
jgi:hypothetical protein